MGRAFTAAASFFPSASLKSFAPTSIEINVPRGRAINSASAAADSDAS